MLMYFNLVIIYIYMMTQTKTKSKRKSVRFNLEKNKTKYFLYDSNSKSRRSTRKLRQRKRTMKRKMRRIKSKMTLHGGAINPIAEIAGIAGALGSGINVIRSNISDSAARPVGHTPINNLKSSLPFMGHYDILKNE
jgi:hypothetical protein